MGQETVIDVLIGSGMPLIVAFLNQAHWSPKTKAFVALLACLVAATAVEFVRGELHWTDWQTTAIVVVGSALATYRLWWQPSTIAPTVEAATSFSPAP